MARVLSQHEALVLGLGKPGPIRTKPRIIRYRRKRLTDPRLDEELIVAYRDGDEFAFQVLLDRYRSLLAATLRDKDYFIKGSSHDDLWQEAYFGFFKAARDFQVGRNFPAFLRLCVQRQIITAVKMANAIKHGPINYFSNIDNLLDDQEPVHLEVYDGFMVDLIWIQKLLTILTPMEKTVFSLFLEGFSYQEVMEKLGYSHKAIDNALQRARKKLKCLVNTDGTIIMNGDSNVNGAQSTSVK